jgi:hypothetical protein
MYLDRDNYFLFSLIQHELGGYWNSWSFKMRVDSHRVFLHIDLSIDDNYTL